MSVALREQWPDSLHVRLLNMEFRFITERNQAILVFHLFDILFSAPDRPEMAMLKLERISPHKPPDWIPYGRLAFFLAIYL